MKPPCRECITFPMCKSRLNEDGRVEVCSLVQKYVDPPDGIYDENRERPMYRQTRINKIRKSFGIKKARKSGIREV